MIESKRTSAMSGVLAATLLMSTAAGLGSSPASADEFTEIRRLGTSNAMCKPGIQSGAELQKYITDNYGDVQKVLRDAGWNGDPGDVYQKIINGEFTESTLAVGTELHWMGIKEKGEPKARQKVRWAGKEAVETFEVVLESNCEVHTLVIPKICCNIALLGVDPAAPPAAPIVSVQTPNICAGDTATVDIVAPANVEMRLTMPSGEAQNIQPTQTDGGFQWQGQLHEAGTYVLSAKTAGQCGVSPSVVETINVKNCEAAAVAAAAPPPAKSYFPFLAPFIGRQDRVRDHCGIDTETDGALIGLLGGLAFPMNDRLNGFVQVGGAADLDESNDSSLFADVGLDWSIGEKGFIGGGIGIWEINDSNDRDGTVFIHGGADTPWSFAGSTVQWFVEGRAFTDELDEIGDNNIVLGGFRMLWK